MKLSSVTDEAEEVKLSSVTGGGGSEVVLSDRRLRQWLHVVLYTVINITSIFVNNYCIMHTRTPGQSSLCFMCHAEHFEIVIGVRSGVDKRYIVIRVQG